MKVDIIYDWIQVNKLKICYLSNLLLLINVLTFFGILYINPYLYIALTLFILYKIFQYLPKSDFKADKHDFLKLFFALSSLVIIIFNVFIIWTWTIGPLSDLD
jgi:hypothetical protein